MIYVVLITLVAMEILFAVLASLGLMITAFFIIDKIVMCHKNWKTKKRNQKIEKDWEKYLQRKQKRLLRKKDKENYPLFYWKDKK